MRPALLPIEEGGAFKEEEEWKMDELKKAYEEMAALQLRMVAGHDDVLRHIQDHLDWLDEDERERQNAEREEAHYAENSCTPTCNEEEEE